MCRLKASNEAIDVLVDSGWFGREDFMTNYCRGCGEECDTVWCQKCVDAGLVKCGHGNDPINCPHCDVEGDMAYDAERER